jgi:hypothetical protein
MITCFQPPPPANLVLMNSALKRWRHWMKNSEFSPKRTDRSLEKLVKNEPEESEPEFAGMVNFSELLPEALVPVSRVARV